MHIRKQVCQSRADAPRMLLCDGCDQGFHIYCLQPRLHAVPDDDEWYCQTCKTTLFDQAPLQEGGGAGEGEGGAEEDAGKPRVGGQDGEEEDSTFEPGASVANSRLGGSSEVFASEEPFDGAGDADSAPREGARGGGGGASGGRARANDVGGPMTWGQDSARKRIVRHEQRAARHSRLGWGEDGGGRGAGRGTEAAGTEAAGVGPGYERRHANGEPYRWWDRKRGAEALASSRLRSRPVFVCLRVCVCACACACFA